MAFGQELDDAGMSRPPVVPPQLPTLSAMQRPVAGSAEDGGPPEGAPVKGAAILRLFHQIDELLKQIAAAVPGQSEDLDDIKTRLSDVMTAIVNGGSRPAESATPSQMDGSRPLA